MIMMNMTISGSNSYNGMNVDVVLLVINSAQLECFLKGQWGVLQELIVLFVHLNCMTNVSLSLKAVYLSKECKFVQKSMAGINQQYKNAYALLEELSGIMTGK